jgi:hypothetical protein
MKTYQVVLAPDFQLLDNAVYVLACIDGRRDIEQVLIRRALRI